MGGTTTSLRTKIVDAARAELKKQSDPPGPQGPISQDPAKRFQEGATEVRGGWERLRDIFSDTVQNFNQAGDPSLKAALGGLPLGKSWCGIFGTHVLHQAGVNAQWDLNTGKMAGAGIKLLKVFEREDTSTIVPGNRTAENLYLEPGDVVSIESKDNHHCVIVSIDIARKTLETIEGNTLYQEIRAGSRKTSVVTAVSSSWTR